MNNLVSATVNTRLLFELAKLDDPDTEFELTSNDICECYERKDRLPTCCRSIVSCVAGYSGAHFMRLGLRATTPGRIADLYWHCSSDINIAHWLARMTTADR
jgi:hypothetical protein